MELTRRQALTALAAVPLLPYLPKRDPTWCSEDQFWNEMGLRGQHGYFFSTYPEGHQYRGFHFWDPKTNLMDLVDWVEKTKVPAAYAWRRHDTVWQPIHGLHLHDKFGSSFLWTEIVYGSAGAGRHTVKDITDLGKYHWQTYQDYLTCDDLAFITRDPEQRKWWMCCLRHCEEELKGIRAYVASGGKSLDEYQTLNAPMYRRWIEELRQLA